MGRRILFGVLFGILVYIAMAVWAGWRDVATAVSKLPLWVMPAACGLSFVNYAVRWIKWQRYLDLLEIKLTRSQSWLVYFAGFSMSVTPGKLGEVFKSWLIKRLNGTPIHHSAPIIVAERFTDLLGYLILIAVAGIASYPEYQIVFWATLGLCVIGFLLAGSEAFARFTARRLKKTPYFWRLSGRVEGSFASTRILLAPRELFLPTVISVISWGCECTGFWLISSYLVDVHVSYLPCVFAYALGAVAGAVLLIFPGGLGMTEGSMGALLRRQYSASGLDIDLARQTATGAVFLTRICTLWFAVLLGVFATMRFTRLYGSVDESGSDS